MFGKSFAFSWLSITGVRNILIAFLAICCLPFGSADSSSSEEHHHRHRAFPALAPILPVLPSRTAAPVIQLKPPTRDCVCVPEKVRSSIKDFHPDRDVEITGNVPDVHHVPAISYPTIVDLYPVQHHRRFYESSSKPKSYSDKQIQQSDDADKLYADRHPHKSIGIELNTEVHQHSHFAGPERKVPTGKGDHKEQTEVSSKEKEKSNVTKEHSKDPVRIDVNLIPIAHNKDTVYHPQNRYPVHTPHIRGHHYQPAYHDYKSHMAY
ncbi:uncharacterized protein LOC129596262 [Paramacrobiotus metropolitanus]|uniref:uncharacterized protein LOC129596262 n=1 Tax=Paramacrobiotus metropolitanus TaxID=2943436 RepID=UPI0024460CE4|nr:uncharacterized protein LOC129596262 [Paramacrobiotus metropolitanus]